MPEEVDDAGALTHCSVGIKVLPMLEMSHSVPLYINVTAPPEFNVHVELVSISLPFPAMVLAADELFLILMMSPVEGLAQSVVVIPLAVCSTCVIVAVNVLLAPTCDVVPL